MLRSISRRCVRSVYLYSPRNTLLTSATFALPCSMAVNSAAHATGARAAGKRSASTSPVKAGRASKAVRTLEEAESFDDFDEDVDFDADALRDAVTAAEQEDARSRSSQPGSGSSSSNKKNSSVADTSSQKTNAQYRHGDDRVESETMDVEWYARVKEEMGKPYFRTLKAFLQRESDAGKTIFPPAHLVHSWSRLTPLSSVKVVVVGQDPYHGVGQACGHSFSVAKGVAVPGSLKNIYKELEQEYGAAFTPPKHGCLDEWARQGVLLLNACLTVGAGQAGSHHNQGWEPFTQTILRAIAHDAAQAPKASVKSSTIASMFSKQAKTDNSSRPAKSDHKPAHGDAPAQTSSKSKGVVFLAWGLPAAKTLAAAGITEASPNVLLLKSAHPSPLSAHRGFLGNGHFKKANEWLESDTRYGPGGGIDWAKL